MAERNCQGKGQGRSLAEGNLSKRQLRKWFGHDPKKWDDFKRKYADELKVKKAALDIIKKMERKKGAVTLVYAAKDEQHNNAVFLLSLLKS